MKERLQACWVVGFAVCLFALMVFCHSLLQGFGAGDCYNNSGTDPLAHSSCAVALNTDLHQANLALLLGVVALGVASAAHYMARRQPMHPEDRF